MKSTNTLLAMRFCKVNSVHQWGAPGAPVIRTKTRKTAWKYMNYDMVVEHTHVRANTDTRLIHYLGKHVPHPQKSLWSPDTPVSQDRHLFMLTTLDIDSFKYWFGVKRCRVAALAWKIISKSGLLPPAFRDNPKIVPKPIFDKEQLMKYYLANRKDLVTSRREEYLNYSNSMVKSAKEREAERPVAPWL